MAGYIYKTGMVGALAAGLFMGGCDQRQDTTNRSTAQPAPAGNSSEK